MARVVFTSHLQRHVSAPEIRVSAGCVAEALAAAFAAQPQVRGYVLDDQGRLRKHVAVFVDGQRLRDREHLSDAVGETSAIYVMQALSGG
jgi:hypothetical protein